MGGHEKSACLNFGVVHHIKRHLFSSVAWIICGSVLILGDCGVLTLVAYNLATVPYRTL